jgi:Zn-finger nucleic acid-binding protein
MRCPIDRLDMIVVEHQSIELDYCLKCRGVWFDSGELDLFVSVLKSQGANLLHHEFLTQKSAKVNEDKRKCPICWRKMDKVWIGTEPKVLIDSCPQGDGLWFDGGELHQVLCQMEPATNTESKGVLSFLGDTFKAECQLNSPE